MVATSSTTRRRRWSHTPTTSPPRSPTTPTPRTPRPRPGPGPSHRLRPRPLPQTPPLRRRVIPLNNHLPMRNQDPVDDTPRALLLNRIHGHADIAVAAAPAAGEPPPAAGVVAPARVPGGHAGAPPGLLGQAPADESDRVHPEGASGAGWHNRRHAGRRFWWVSEGWIVVWETCFCLREWNLGIVRISTYSQV